MVIGMTGSRVLLVFLADRSSRVRASCGNGSLVLRQGNVRFLSRTHCMKPKQVSFFVEIAKDIVKVW